MTDYDKSKVSPRPWRVRWDVTLATYGDNETLERLQFDTKGERDAIVEEWDECHESKASKCYWIEDAEGNIVEWGELYSSYGFGISEEDVEHVVYAVNHHDPLVEALEEAIMSYDTDSLPDDCDVAEWRELLAAAKGD